MSDDEEKIFTADDSREIKKAVKLAEESIESQRICMICGTRAEYCMRGIPKNLYCKECAQDYFKFLNYLESLK